MTEINI